MLSSGAASDVSSIAVRPFIVLSDERELQFLADGLGEDVIALLARVPGFFVIAKASSFEFRSADIPTSAIAQQLGVRYVLGGSVRALGGKIRLSAQLAEAASARVLWSGQFDAERSDAINLQDEIARAIIVELQPALTRADRGDPTTATGKHRGLGLLPSGRRRVGLQRLERAIRGGSAWVPAARVGA